MPRWSLAALFLGTFAVTATAQKSPEETVKSMTVADGLQVELFAAEPMVINPTSMDVDHLGRVWVCEAVNYRNKMFKKPLNRPEGDRIVILTDKDGDGKADESTVFYQGPELYGPITAPGPSKRRRSRQGDFLPGPPTIAPTGPPCSARAWLPPSATTPASKTHWHADSVSSSRLAPTRSVLTSE